MKNNNGIFIIELKKPYSVLEYNDTLLQQINRESKNIHTLRNIVAPQDYNTFVRSFTRQITSSNTTTDSIRLSSKGGSLLPVTVTGKLFTLKDGREVLQCICVPTNNTQTNNKQTNLSDLLEFSQTIRCGISKHLCDNALTIQWANDFFFDLSGYSKEEYTQKHKSSFLSMIYEPDLSIVVNSITSLLEDHEIDITFRIKHKTKKICWINLIGSLLPETVENYPLAGFVLNDVTNLKYAETKAELEAKKYEIISDISEEIPYEYEIETDIITYAPKYESIFGRKSIYKHPSQKFIAAGYVSADTQEAFSSIFKAAKDGESLHNTEYKLRNRNGDYEWHYSSFSLIRDENDNPIRAVGILRNINTLKEEQLTLLKRAQTDSMTGLLNKATIEGLVKEQLKTIQAGSNAVAMLIDIDDFKDINDTYGHLMGDEVITTIAHVLTRYTFNDGYIGRLGGDEFLVYLPNVLDISLACEKAQHYAEYLQQKFPGNNNKPTVSLSIGIAATDVAIPYSDLIEHADAAVYAAKSKGKNCYMLYNNLLERTEYHNERNENLCLYDSTIINNTLGILCENENVCDSIQKAINYIGTMLNADRIAIWEYQQDRSFLDKTFDWQSASYPYSDGNTENLASFQWEEVDNLSIDGIYHTANAKALKLNTFGKGTFLGVQEFLQAKIEYNAICIGYLGFFNYSNDDVWSTKTIETYKIFSKILKSYIQQKHIESFIQ